MKAKSHASIYFITWILLLAVTTASLLVSFIHLGSLDLVVALVFSAVKAVLVAMIFMHIGKENVAIQLAFVVAILMIAILVSLTSLDLLMRS